MGLKERLNFEIGGALKKIPSNMNILIACEESQAIANAFRKRGFKAYSCDLQECSGGHPEYHIQGDCLSILKTPTKIHTCDGKQYTIPKWDLIIAHPPCTYLTVSGNRWFDVEKYGDKAIERQKNREEAISFFMEFTNLDAEHIAIENPIGVMSTTYRKPDQIIEPWMWGDNTTKKTCLWTKNLPQLIPSVTEKPEIEYKEWIDPKTGRKKRQAMDSYAAFGKDRQKTRSKTYLGTAEAIAEQWGNYLTKENEN